MVDQSDATPDELLHLRDVIVPVFGVLNNKTDTFLGTGSIIGDGSILLTADHVTRDWSKGPLAIWPIRAGRAFAIELIERDEAHDLAIFRIDGYRPARPLIVEFDTPVQENNSLMTYEYGTTVNEEGKTKLNPATRLGHMTRHVDVSHSFGPAGEGAMELSFPALRGASGAPVMFNELLQASRMGKHTMGVVGVIIANASYHLAPSQIESVLTEDNKMLQEVRFMLPQGLAVSVKHLRPMYDRAMASGASCGSPATPESP